MPCSQRKARILLKEKKAHIIGYRPFTIQLDIITGETTQEVAVGIDEGARHIGIAVTSGTKVLAKGEVELRQDIHSLLIARKEYRRNRRYRKTRYRKCRFNRTKPEGWLAPSIEAKLNANFNWIDKFYSLLPNPKLIIEVGKFDVAKMINPDIQGIDYQHGQTYGYYDTRYFVFERDRYTCQCCHKLNKILHTHHIIYKSLGGTNRADNLITVCTECHTSENHNPGGIFYTWMIQHKKVRQYKAPAFMNTIRKRTFDRYLDATFTYGSETVVSRKNLGLEKTHYNDAIAITEITAITDNPDEWFYIKQFRKKKRSLHEATARKGRKIPNRTQKRSSKNTKNVDNWFLGDRVTYHGQTGWITGFTGKTAYIQDIQGQYIFIPGKTYKQIAFSHLTQKEHIGNWQYTYAI